MTLDAAWTIEGRSTDSGTYTKRWAGKGDSIPAHGHYLIVGSSYAQSPAKDDGLHSPSLRYLQGKLSLAEAICQGRCPPLFRALRWGSKHVWEKGQRTRKPFVHRTEQARHKRRLQPATRGQGGSRLVP